MLHKLLPQRIDNTYRGHKFALWLFALIVLMKIVIGLNTIFNGRLVATTADGIPLDTFTPAGVQTVLALFAIWGVAHLIICLLCALILARYRAMVPLMFTLLVLEFLSRKLVLYFLPIVRIGSPPGFFVNLALLALMIVGLMLSLRSQDNLQAQE